MATWLERRGFQVEVLTALPNYPQGRIHDDYRRRLYVVEELQGLRVVRTPVYPSRDAGLVKRMANYLSFVASSMFFGLFLTRRADVIICESPPLFLGISAVFLKVFKRCRLIFNVSDLWPESASRMGVHDRKFFIWLATKLERACYRASDAATAQSPGIVRGIQQKQPDAVVELIPNGCDCETFHPDRRNEDFRRQHGVEEKIVVGYAGLVGLAQGLNILIELAEQFRDDDRVSFLIAGDGPEREQIELEMRSRNLQNFIFTGWMSKQDMPRTVASFDIAFIPLRYFIPGALPSKIYEAMASQVPIVLAAEGDPRELLLRAEAGVAVNYNDPDEIVTAIRRLVDESALRKQLGINGREYVLQHHQRPAIAAKLGSVIESVVEGNTPDLKRAA